MKTLKKSILLLTSLVVAVSAASCINDELTEPQKEVAVKELATVDEQAASMEATLADLEALQTSAEGLDEELASVVSSIENHIADLKSGASLLDGTLATLERQKELAEVMAALEFGAEDTKGGAALTKAVASVDKKAESWLGKHFAAYYPAAKAEAAAAARLTALDLKTQKLSVEAILSDVEAGLRKNADKEELTALAAKIESNADEVAELLAALTETRTEVETEYAETVETAVTDPSGFDLPALKQFNSAVAGTLAEADNSLAGLIARVEACEVQLKNIKTRLGELESTVADLNELLDLIQSVTFMSEYSAENAIAYYTLGSESREDGKKVRKPQGTIDLRYVIRPASAAQALTSPDLWDNEVKVFGYYANTITKAAPKTFDFDITNVTDDGAGIVTVTVSAEFLNESFYFKETGAKLALSIATGKTDLTSKFVEVVPKDASGTVYLESLTLPVDYVEIDDGQSYQLNAKITPANVTDAKVIWTTSNIDVVEVSGTGKLDAKAVGNVAITVTSNSTDEWGRQLSATCNVKVTPNIKLNAPSYIEEGGTMEIKVESPEYIDPSLITWSVSKWENGGQYVATIDENGVVTATHHTYNTANKAYDPIYVTCSIYDGQTVIKHELRIVVPQPKKIVISGKGDNENSHTVKVGSEYSLASTIYPDAVQSSGYFGIIYQSSYTAVASVDFNSGLVKAHAPGKAQMTITARSVNTGRYAYPSGTEWKRYFDIIVEPYWVETISLPETLTLAPEATATLTPVFTSDVDGNPPTYTSVTWTSSDPNVVSVDEKTGELTAITVGSARITATTVDGATSDSNPKSASCVVTVRVPVAEVKVGDYYYSDGTWGSNPRPSGKSVIGVIISNANAAGADPILMRDYPKCFNGLVLGLSESSSAFGNYRVDGGYGNSLYDGTYGIASYGAVLSDTAPTGYGLTLAYVNYRENIKSSSGYGDSCILFDQVSGVAANYNNQVATPSSASAWYVPSRFEMDAIYENKSVINTALSAVSGTQISNERYWSSYVYNKKLHDKNSTYHDCYAYPIDMSNGSWITNANNTTSYKVRVILAF